MKGMAPKKRDSPSEREREEENERIVEENSLEGLDGEQPNLLLLHNSDNNGSK